MYTYVYTHKYTQRYDNDEHQPRPAHAAGQAGGDARDIYIYIHIYVYTCVYIYICLERDIDEYICIHT